jgi:chromosome segregation protein
VPLNFARMKIAGFKSFVEPTTVEIGPGLSGIVGPNGCGKSNIVEALRWAMGESSAKSVRGDEMEDVIFAGTEQRPARSLAEVVISIENSDGSAPPPLSEAPVIEISRRIERGRGSTYRVNGKEWRARDLSTLLSDAATGAHSSGLISQGRVGALIAMKPEARRVLLEEAAGVTGLYARRHEAELKLRATESNLARLDDVKIALEAQLTNLRKQVRQANKWKTISRNLTELEAALLGIRHARAERTCAAAEAVLREAELAEAEAAANAAAAATSSADATAALPRLRQDEASARDRASEARHRAESVEAELRTAEATLSEARRELQQLLADQNREGAIAADAKAAIDRLEAEAARLSGLAADDPRKLEEAALAQRDAASLVAATEIELTRATEAAANLAARIAALSAERAEGQSRLARISKVAAELARSRAEAEARLVEAGALDAAQQKHELAQTSLIAAREAVDLAERATAKAREASSQTARALSAADAARNKIEAECRVLSDVLGTRDGDLWPPLVDSVAVPMGLETAFGAAMGEALDSTADHAADKYWRELPPIEYAAPLPAGAKAFSSLVEGPAALGRALAQTGLVESVALGQALQPSLVPGQVLVTLDGAIFRWDGFTVRAGTPTAAALRLAQRNRLKQISAELTQASQAAGRAKADHEAAAAAEGNAIARLREAQDTRRAADSEADKARNLAHSLGAQATSASGRLAAISEQEIRLAADRAEAEALLARAEHAAEALPSLDTARSAQAEARARQAEARAREGEARSMLERVRSETRARQVRGQEVAREQTDWTRRMEVAAARLSDMAARRTAAATALEQVEARMPGLLAARVELADGLASATQSLRQAADELATAEERAVAVGRMLREADLMASRASEVRATSQGNRAAALATVQETGRAISDRLQVEPASLVDALMADNSDLLSDMNAEAATRERIDRLVKDRDAIGAVNLAAEQEADDLQTRLSELANERADLDTAIAKLRGAIGTLNRDGRERISSRFEEINANFKDIFSQLFGGGRAHLALVGSDDPLEAGLEVYASPPGKKLASLALLSGGEQALTALSLIFAVFLCNPAPICVLDEVDAPLDEANVDRFCDMIDRIANSTGTRFLVVTHHRTTMARMDRLFGVTMQERGVSRIVSVDLKKASALVSQPHDAGLLVAAE